MPTSAPATSMSSISTLESVSTMPAESGICAFGLDHEAAEARELDVFGDDGRSRAQAERAGSPRAGGRAMMRDPRFQCELLAIFAAADVDRVAVPRLRQARRRWWRSPFGPDRQGLRNAHLHGRLRPPCLCHQDGRRRARRVRSATSSISGTNQLRARPRRLDGGRA